MNIISVDRITEIGIDLFTIQGVSKEKASFLVKTLVEANLAGHDSHGVHYYLAYSDRIKKGHIKIDLVPEIVKETPASALIDGKWTMGQITAMKLTEVAVKKAKESMMAGVGAFNCNHIGRLGYYTEWAAKHDIIANMYVNVGNRSVAVHAGLGRAFGTNPYSISVPTGIEIPFLVDYASSVVAAGKISVARAKKEKIPKHWTRDKYGRVTDDPNDFFDDGWQLPFGEYKGYGIQLASELLGAVLTGSRSGQDPPVDPPSSNGVFMIAINPEAFIGLDEFKKKTGEILNKIKKLPAVSGERILVPGEPEKETKEYRSKNGIELPDTTWNSIVALCKELGVDSSIN